MASGMTEQPRDKPMKTIRRSGATARGASQYIIAEGATDEWTVRGTPMSSSILRRTAKEHEALLKRLADR